MTIHRVRVSQLQYELWLVALGSYWADFRNRMPVNLDGTPIDLSRDIYRTIAHLTPCLGRRGHIQ